jgi:hypothetical protein
MNQLQYQTYSFQILSIIMVIYFFYHWSQNPLQKSLLLWSTLVIATPIPNASILLSFPAKVFFDIPLYISQIITSVISILFILFIPSMSQPSFLKNILRQRKYYIFILSILSSILIANIIDEAFNKQYSIPKILIASIMCLVYIQETYGFLRPSLNVGFSRGEAL